MNNKNIGYTIIIVGVICAFAMFAFSRWIPTNGFMGNLRYAKLTIYSMDEKADEARLEYYSRAIGNIQNPLPNGDFNFMAFVESDQIEKEKKHYLDSLKGARALSLPLGQALILPLLLIAIGWMVSKKNRK